MRFGTGPRTAYDAPLPSTSSRPPSPAYPDSGEVSDAVGQTCAAFVEHDNPCERAEPIEPPGNARLSPIVLASRLEQPIRPDDRSKTSPSLLSLEGVAPDRDPVTLKRYDLPMARDRSTCRGRVPVADC